MLEFKSINRFQYKDLQAMHHLEHMGYGYVPAQQKHSLKQSSLWPGRRDTINLYRRGNLGKKDRLHTCGDLGRAEVGDLIVCASAKPQRRRRVWTQPSPRPALTLFRLQMIQYNTEFSAPRARLMKTCTVVISLLARLGFVWALERLVVEPYAGKKGEVAMDKF